MTGRQQPMLETQTLKVFVYDVTNSVLIPVSPQVITANGTNNFYFKGVFQTASNSTSYRLIFHVATANANATGWTFKVGVNVFVGPPRPLQREVCWLRAGPLNTLLLQITLAR